MNTAKFLIILISKNLCKQLLLIFDWVQIKPLQCLLFYNTCTAWKVSKYRIFSGPYFPAFGLNTERYGVSLRIQPVCEKIRTRKNSVFGHFSRGDEEPNLHDIFNIICIMFICASFLFQSFIAGMWHLV